MILPNKKKKSALPNLCRSDVVIETRTPTPSFMC